MTLLSRIFLIVTTLGGIGCILLGLLLIKPEKERMEGVIQTQATQIDGLEKNLASEKKAKEEALGVVKRQEGEIEQLNTDLNQKKTELASTSQELDQKKSEIEKILSSLPEGVTIDQVPARFKEFQDNLAALDAEKQVLSEQLTKVMAEKKKLDDYIKNRAAGNVPVGLTGRILAVNPDWNFVVIDVGQNHGVFEKVPMMVHRDGALIGKVMISSVEPSISIADIMGEWKQTEFHEGDLVSF
jgi:prefoldin subunit 5